ncbi:F-box protein [Raphanus sativus]|nr:F-box protein [Raphanus sativus]
MDFVSNLDGDMCLAILSCLDDPSDLVRASAVSRSWRHFAKGCTSSPIQSCIADAIAASSTDRLPAESISNTLDERDRVGRTPSYWSSAGHHNPSVPETLLYKLKADLCLITQLSIHPFQVYYYPGRPICSSHYVRFRLGHLNNHSQDKNNYVWAYTSPQFALAQENRLQKFKLPEPVLCIGGYLLVEFLGRVQRCDADDLYYICVTHVKAMGRSLAKSFRVVDPDESSGKFGLKVLSYSDPQEMNDKEEEAGPSEFRTMRNRRLEQLVDFLHRHPTDVVQYAAIKRFTVSK